MHTCSECKQNEKYAYMRKPATRKEKEYKVTHKTLDANVPHTRNTKRI